MKPSTLLKIMLALAATPFGISAAAFAGTDTTFSSTPQSAVVLKAIGFMRAGKLEEFRALLSDKALARYGTEAGMKELKERFERLAGDADISMINTRSDREGQLKPESWGGLVSNRVYNVEVMKPSSSTDTILNTSVQCSGFFEPIVPADQGCVIPEVSANTHPSQTLSQPEDLVRVHNASPTKQISDTPVAAAFETAPEAGNAAAAASLGNTTASAVKN